MLVGEFLEQSARRLPGKTALVCDGRRVTYAALDTQANGLAHALLEAGVSRGDRVAVFLENSVEAVVALFGALKAGAVFVMINPTTKADKVAYIANNCRAAAVAARDARRLARWHRRPSRAGCRRPPAIAPAAAVSPGS